MEGDSKSKQRCISRCFERSRLEEEVWMLAYEQVWPLIRRPVVAKTPALKSELELMEIRSVVARRA